MDRETENLREVFVEAYPLYVAGILTQRGIEICPVIADAVVEGTAVLDGLLRSLGEVALPEQRSSPLELFREALRPIDRALDLVGVPIATEGGGARKFAPWDRHSLAPGSSQILGTTAHEAHVRWGIVKARSMASAIDSTLGPAVGLFCSLTERPTMVAQAETAGYRTVTLPSDDEIAVAFVSADEPGADDIVRSVAAAARVVVYGESIDDFDRVRYAALGAYSVLTSQECVGRLVSHLPPIV